MSWVKKVWNRMFTDEVEEEIEPKYEAPVEQKRSHVPFRFPLITDEEREVFLRKEQSGEKVTMAEVREELIRRPSQTLQQRVSPEKRPEPRPEPRLEPRPLQRPAQRQPIKQQPQAAKPKLEDIKPEPIKRRFEPTRVPSPIHGFNERKPAPIEILLGSMEVKEESHKSIAPSQASTIEDVTEAIKATEAKELPVQKPDTVAVQKETRLEAIDTTEEDSVEESLQPLQTDKPAHMDAPLFSGKPEIIVSDELKKVHSEPLQEKNSASPAIEASPVRKKEKTVPFNVLMLKSDKEKSKKHNAVPVKPQPAPEVKLLPTEEEPTESATPLEAVVPEINDVKPVASYDHPHSNFLLEPENDRKDDVWMEEQGDRLIEALSHFQVQATIISIVQGPAVTQFEMTVAQGVKVSKIRNLADDLKLALAAKDIRIQAPIPGKSSIGIEIPNRTSRPVRISEVIESPQFRDSDSPLEAALGLDLTGKPVTLDLRKMPHGLIAGATGSGKSVCINSLLVSLLYKSSPQDLKLLLIDPKMVELAPYNHIPHLVSPVITDVKAATASLKWAVSEMERRYQLFAHTGVRDIDRYNKTVKEKGNHAQHLPYILIVIDELADLMMMSPSDVEDAICRIAQKARACGIHLVIATQRPSVDVITGLIKSNIPTRIAFSVSSQVDSRTILDSQGAERLLGKGDMLYLGNGMSAPSRIQGTFVTDEEIERIIEHVRSQGEPEYFFKEEELIRQSGSGTEQDDLFEEACRFIMQQGSASTSLLQRKFHIGYNRAARLMDLIEEHGFISEQNGSKARSVLITEDDMSEVFQ